ALCRPRPHVDHREVRRSGAQPGAGRRGETRDLRGRVTAVHAAFLPHFGGLLWPFMATSSGVPTGIRTPVTAVKGRCPRPLDDGDEAECFGTERLVVELSGIEPLASCMPCKRSPS